jgi:hypothetical protein
MDWDKKINNLILFVLLTVILACNKNQYGVYHAYVGDFIDTVSINTDTSWHYTFSYKPSQNTGSSALLLMQDSVLSNELVTIENKNTVFKPDSLYFENINHFINEKYDSTSFELNDAYLNNGVNVQDSLTAGFTSENNISFISDTSKENSNTIINKDVNTTFNTVDTTHTDTTTITKLNHIEKIEINQVDTVILNINSITVNNNNIDSSIFSDITQQTKISSLQSTDTVLKTDTVYLNNTVFMAENNIKPIVKSTIQVTDNANTNNKNSIEIADTSSVNDTVNTTIQLANSINDTVFVNQNYIDTIKNNDSISNNQSQVINQAPVVKTDSLKNNKPYNKKFPTDSIVTVIYKKIKHELNGEIDDLITKKIDSLVNNQLQEQKIPTIPKPIFQQTDTVYYELNQIAVNTPLPKVNDSNKNCLILLSSFTDALGNETYNLQLSKKRADYIKSALLKNGFKESNIFIQYFGEKYATGNHQFDRKLIIKFICIE